MARRKRDREKRKGIEFNILFLKFTNEPKVYTKDVISSLSKVDITLFFCASKDFRYSESIIHFSKITFIH